MKKNIIIAAIAAASALLLCASCQKQELIEQDNVNAEGKTFTANIEQGLTKSTITSEYKVNWDQGDQIDIDGAIFSAMPDASDATKAIFTKVSGSDPDGEFGYTAVYPASIMVGSQPNLPATQTYAEGKFNAPMCAMSSTESLEFKNFCGVLCFALKGTGKVKSIAVTANEQICGPFDFADATSISFSGENEGKTVTLDCGEGVQLNETTATNFYVYMPPFDSYTAGMKITVTNTEGKTFTKTTTKSVKIERNNIYTFNWAPSFDVKPRKWNFSNIKNDYADEYAAIWHSPDYWSDGGTRATNVVAFDGEELTVDGATKIGFTEGLFWTAAAGKLLIGDGCSKNYQCIQTQKGAQFYIPQVAAGDTVKFVGCAPSKAGTFTFENAEPASIELGKGTSYNEYSVVMTADGNFVYNAPQDIRLQSIAVIPPSGTPTGINAISR